MKKNLSVLMLLLILFSCRDENKKSDFEIESSRDKETKTLSGSLNVYKAAMSTTISSPIESNMRLDGPGQVNSDITDPARYEIVLTGPLAGKTITNTQWTVPDGWNIWFSNNNYIELFPQTGAATDFLEVSFDIDGSPAYLSKYIRVFARSH